ncbi:transposase [Neokomagataea tanensis NBRC 106556]|uniref:Transposase n=1 Tax=Neokomagataea tanensis NBRC 106556 TaxID=1223519 RepID=A0ABQ0QJJ2_9PROT|nr:transposase [Neokomagataea tanensis NBRC 106556]
MLVGNFSSNPPKRLKMNDLFWLTNEQIERYGHSVPRATAKPHTANRRMLGGIIFVSRNGPRRRDAPLHVDDR